MLLNDKQLIELLSDKEYKGTLSLQNNFKNVIKMISHKFNFLSYSVNISRDGITNEIGLRILSLLWDITKFICIHTEIKDYIIKLTEKIISINAFPRDWSYIENLLKGYRWLEYNLEKIKSLESICISHFGKTNVRYFIFNYSELPLNDKCDIYIKITSFLQDSFNECNKYLQIAKGAEYFYKANEKEMVNKFINSMKNGCFTNNGGQK